MLLPTYINVNRGGIPAISSVGVNVSTTEVQFDFNNHRNVGAPFRGLLIVRLNQAAPQLLFPLPLPLVEVMLRDWLDSMEQI